MVVGLLHCGASGLGPGIAVGIAHGLSFVLGSFVTVLTNKNVLVTVARGNTVHLYLVKVRISVAVALTFWMAVGAGATTVLTMVVVVSVGSTTVSVDVVVVRTVLTMVGVTCSPKHVAVSMSEFS